MSLEARIKQLEKSGGADPWFGMRVFNSDEYETWQRSAESHAWAAADEKHPDSWSGLVIILGNKHE